MTAIEKNKIPEWDTYEYSEVCTCGVIHTIYTQKDEAPEYHTDIYLLCSCGLVVQFQLPVN